MANKIFLSLNVKQIDKAKLRKNKWTDKEDVEHDELLLDVEVVELNDKQFVKETEKSRMMKTHFAKEGWFTEEDKFIGSGFNFEPKNAPESQNEPNKGTVDYPTDEINPDDIPF
jgi:hypothetical protein